YPLICERYCVVLFASRMAWCEEAVTAPPERSATLMRAGFGAGLGATGATVFAVTTFASSGAALAIAATRTSGCTAAVFKTCVFLTDALATATRRAPANTIA